MTGPTTGRLRPTSSPAAAPAATSSRASLAVSVIDGRQHRPTKVPRTNVTGAMRLCTRGEVHGIRAACRAMMAELGITGGGIESFAEWREEFNLRMVATAMRHPDSLDVALAELDEWRQCDEDQLATLWCAYEDMAADLDPLGETYALSQTDYDEIVALAKAGDVGQLTSFGSPRLARALRSLAAPAAS